MSSMDGIAPSSLRPLSLKAACIGFVASTALLTLVMTLVGNLG